MAREPSGLQLELPLARPPLQAPALAATPVASARLRERLARLAGEDVRLSIHDNRSTMVSYRRMQGTLELRLHHMFLDADEGTVRALSEFVTARRERSRAGLAIDAFVRSHQARIRPSEPRPHLEPRGRQHDLAQLYASLNERWFGGAIDARIGWGRLPPRRRRRTIKMGVYYHESRTILIHPALDRPEVPEFVVGFVVYHEMLHQAVPPIPGRNGRKRIHPPAFVARERAHPDRARALAWEKANLSMLLGPRLRPRGSPPSPTG